MAAAEATYAATPGIDTPEHLRDLVRMLAGDTGREGDFFLADTEVDWLIGQRTYVDQPRPYLAAADVLDAMAARVAQRSDLVRVGDVQRSDTKDSLQSKFKALAKQRRMESISRDPGEATVVVLTGGADTRPGDTTDDDAVGRWFRTGQWEDHRTW